MEVITVTMNLATPPYRQLSFKELSLRFRGFSHIILFKQFIDGKCFC